MGRKGAGEGWHPEGGEPGMSSTLVESGKYASHLLTVAEEATRVLGRFC